MKKLILLTALFALPTMADPLITNTTFTSVSVGGHTYKMKVLRQEGLDLKQEYWLSNVHLERGWQKGVLIPQSARIE